MIDGVNKFFLLYHRDGAMHFDGCKTLVDVVGQAVMVASGRIIERAEFDALITSCRSVLDRIVEARDRVDRIVEAPDRDDSRDRRR